MCCAYKYTVHTVFLKNDKKVLFLNPCTHVKRKCCHTAYACIRKLTPLDSTVTYWWK